MIEKVRDKLVRQCNLTSFKERHSLCREVRSRFLLSKGGINFPKVPVFPTSKGLPAPGYKPLPVPFASALEHFRAAGWQRASPFCTVLGLPWLRFPSCLPTGSGEDQAPWEQAGQDPQGTAEISPGCQETSSQAAQRGGCSRFPLVDRPEGTLLLH